MAGPTVIPTISPEAFAQRIAALFPNGWASPDAAQGGVLHALLLSFGQQLNAVLGQVAYAKDAVLIETETAPELDLASVDFFGNTLPRPPGATDAQFSALILANMFQSAASRPALSNAIRRLTGQTPRMIDPWNPDDTGAWDATTPGFGLTELLADGSGLPIFADGGGALLLDPPVPMGAARCFWDVDTAVNPARWTGEEPWTGFIETVLPPTAPVLGGNPVQTFDDSAFWDVPGYLFVDMILPVAGGIYSLVNRLRAYGITIGVKIIPNPM